MITKNKKIHQNAELNPPGEGYFLITIKTGMRSMKPKIWFTISRTERHAFRKW
jgi:hypothetical protein